MNRSKLLSLIFAAVATAMSANAATLTLSAVNGNLYQQTVQSPCIFSNSSCQNGTFLSTDVPNGGNVTNWDLTTLASPSYYLGSDLLNIIGNGSLIIGVDINQASGQGPQTLTRFEMLVGGNVVDTYIGTTGNVGATNNGNGYADYILTGFTAFSPTAHVQFRAVFNDLNDGAENLFVIGGTRINTVPEPSSMALIGTGLAGLGFLARRRKK